MAGDAGDQAKVTKTSTPVAERVHRVHWFTGRTHEVLTEVSAVMTETLGDRERAETLAEVVRLRDRLDALAAKLMADDNGVIDRLHLDTRITAATGRRLSKRSVALAEHPATHQALAAGEIHTDQAAVITTAVDRLPEEVAHLGKEAEAHLLELALEYDAKTLAGMAKHLLHVIAPDQADELLAKALEKEEADARRRSFLKTFNDGHGSVHGKFKIPALHGHLLDTLLAAITNPGRPDPIDRTNLDTIEIRGQAFCELLEKIDPKKLPQTGGPPVSVIVTMTLDTLTGGLKAAGILGTTLQLSPGEARRLAARHGVIPCVLGSKSEPLDLGRHKRFFTTPQRTAMAIRQGGLCNIQGCDVPATMCEANHGTDWTRGGKTDLDDGELICPRHHTQHHQGRSLPRRT